MGLGACTPPSAPLNFQDLKNTLDMFGLLELDSLGPRKKTVSLLAHIVHQLGIYVTMATHFVARPENEPQSPDLPLER